MEIIYLGVAFREYVEAIAEFCPDNVLPVPKSTFSRHRRHWRLWPGLADESFPGYHT